MRTVFVFCSGVLVLFAITAPAQVTVIGGRVEHSKHTAAGPEASNQQTKQLSTTSDFGAEALPRHYAGDAPEALFAGMELPKKAEFESTAAYEARLAERTKSPQVARFLVSGEIKYDADRETFVVRLRESSYFIRNTRIDKHVLEIKDATLSARDYQASNVFGATATVTHSDSVNYRVMWGSLGLEGKDADFYTEEPEHFVEVPVPVRDAPALKPRLRVLLVCTALSPRISKHTVTTAHPTLTLPVAGSTEYQYLEAGSVAVWVFDDETGRILVMKAIPVVRPRVGIDVPVPQCTRYVQPVRDEYATHVSGYDVFPDQGVVVIEGTIRYDGKVIDARVQTPAEPRSPLLDGSALRAVEQWEFAPTVVNGVAASVDFLVKVGFSVAYKDSKGHRLKVPVATVDTGFVTP